MILIDTDMIVARSLAEIVDEAAAGKVVAFENDTERHVQQWGEVLNLGAPRRQPYVSFSLVALGLDDGPEILRLLADRQDRIDFDLTYWRQRRITSYPLLYADQDVLNAILATCVARDRLVVLEQRLSPLPPFEGLKVADPHTLRCIYEDGSEPLVVHHWLAKPWLEPTHHGVYSQLLHRLLVGEDIAIRVPEAEIPVRFRAGLIAFAERKRINARERLRYHVREPLSSLGRGDR